MLFSQYFSARATNQVCQSFNSETACVITAKTEVTVEKTALNVTEEFDEQNKCRMEKCYFLLLISNAILKIIAKSLLLTSSKEVRKKTQALLRTVYGKLFTKLKLYYTSDGKLFIIYKVLI